MTRAAGVGSLPGEDYREAVKLVLGETPDLPALPELPGRGAPASMTGRALAVLDGLGADLQPAGWRLTGSTAESGVDHRRARSLLAQDLDVVEEEMQGYAGPFKVQVAGPWTLAATVEKPRGDRVLSDHGARRELAEALAEGLAGHVADLRRRLPGAEITVQVDEPALPAVLAGQVPTASGFHRHRSVDAPKASPALETVFAAVRAAGATPLAHCCAAGGPGRAAHRCRRRRGVGRPDRAGRLGLRPAGDAAGGRCAGPPRRGPVAAAGRRPPAGWSSGCCGSSTCSGSTRTGWGSRWW